MGNGIQAAIARRNQRVRYEAAVAANLTSIPGGTWAAQYQASTGEWPANNQVPSVGKDSSGNFSPSTLDKIEFGNTPAPKGHFILKAFDRNYEEVSGITDATLTALREIDETRPTTGCSAFGRIWYAGTSNQVNQGFVLFSQIGPDISNFERCYQENDPTSEELSDLLDTDGGVIPIQNSGFIACVLEAFQGVLVLASNGVWIISGTESTGFTATGYSVVKITDAGCMSRDSVVTADGIVYYWSDGGIYAISKTNTGALVSTSLTQNSIQSFYNAIPDSLKRYVEGVHSTRNKVIYWLYGEDSDKPLRKSKILAYDVDLGAFYPYATIEQQSLDAIYGETSYITSFIAKPYFTDVLYQEDVFDSSDTTITDSLGGSVYTEYTLASEEQPTLKLLTTVPTNLGHILQFSEFNNTDFKDWGTESYISYADSGTITGGDVMRNKQAQYATVYFNRTEDGYELDGNGNVTLSNQSGCLVSTKWDWTSSANANKWSNPQQAYRLKRLYIPMSVSDSFDYSFDVVSTKLLVRGKGKGFKFRFESDGDKNFELIGFGVPVTMDSNV